MPGRHGVRWVGKQKHDQHGVLIGMLECHCQREYSYYGTFVSLHSEHLEMSLGLEGGQYTLRHRTIPQITQTGNVFGKLAGPKSIDLYLGI